MIPSLSQETITEYASEAQTIQEPTGTDYTQGVRVGKTVPAKWWNWLFKGATRRLGQSRADAQSMLTELQNAVTDAGIALDASDSHQLSKAVLADAYAQVDKYVEDKRALYSLWYANSTVINGINCILCEGTLQQLDSSHMLALFRTNSSPSSQPGNVYYVCTSTDGNNWDVIYTTQLSFLSIGAVYFNGQYYLLISYAVNGQDIAILLRSQNCTAWSTVFTHSEEQPSSYRKNAWISVAGDMLLVQELDNDSIYYSLDGTNFTSIRIGPEWASWHPVGDNTYTNALPAYQLTETKYVVLKYCVNISDRTISSASSSIYDYYYGSTKLLNGTVAVCYNISRSTTRQVTTLFKPDGTIGFTEDYYVKDNIEGYIVSKTDGYTISSDGGNTYVHLPFSLQTVLDDIAILLDDTGGNIVVYNRAGALTANPSDYTAVCTWNYSEHGYSLHAIRKGIIVNGTKALSGNYGLGHAASLSFDYGHTWKDIEGVQPKIPVTVSVKGGVYAENAYSTPLINKVSGFTLYLR